MRVLAAARAEFAKSGYAGASLRTIASAAGVTTPVLYDPFASKADLYAAVVGQQTTGLLLEWAQPPMGSAEDVFNATINSIFRWVEKHPDGWRILFAEPPVDAVASSVLARAQERASTALTALFADLPTLDTPSELSRAQADAAYAAAAKSAINGLASWWWGNRDVPREAVVTLATDLLWHGLGDVTRIPTSGDQP